ncbi:hypothetical protein L7F22_011974 [Adiantum nelumboides]|nr:hypothetical protein [Adiantum nelumboides]
MSGTAAVAAKKGVGLLFSATKSSLSALSVSVSKARKTYGSKHESSVLAELKNRGLRPADYLFEALQKVYFLYMAGYKNEVVASALSTGKRLTDIEKTSVSLDVVTAFGHSVCDECLKYGDFEKGKFQQSMQDFLNKARTGKEHFDRDSLVHDVYYAVLITAELIGTEWQNLEDTFREAASRVVGNAIHATAGTADARKKAAKALYLFAAQVRTAAQDSEIKRQKAIKEAETLLRKEQERQRASQLALPSTSNGSH